MRCYALMNDAGQFLGSKGPCPFNRAMNYIRSGQMDKAAIYNGKTGKLHWPGKLPGFHEVIVTFQVGAINPHAGAVYWIHQLPNRRWESKASPRGVTHLRAALFYESQEEAPPGSVPVSLIVDPQE